MGNGVGGGRGMVWRVNRDACGRRVAAFAGAVVIIVRHSGRGTCIRVGKHKGFGGMGSCSSRRLIVALHHVHRPDGHIQTHAASFEQPLLASRLLSCLHECEALSVRGAFARGVLGGWKTAYKSTHTHTHTHTRRATLASTRSQTFHLKQTVKS